MYDLPSPQVAGAQPPGQGLSRGVMIFSVILGLLLMLSGSGIIYYAAVARPAQLQAQATATVQTRLTNDKNATVTAIAQANQQATTTARANANATATTQAQTQATATTQQNIYTKVTSGTPVVNSSLAFQTASSWDIGSANDGSSCSFQGGALHVSSLSAHYYFPCFAQASNFANFALEIQMTIARGDGGGILFRSNNTTSQFYFIQIDQKGNYDFMISKDATHNTSIDIDHSTSFNASVGQANTLTIIAQGSTLDLYINKQFATSVNDATYSMGKIGVFSADEANPTEVVFSNLRVWQL